jgi:hypothetical protein
LRMRSWADVENGGAIEPSGSFTGWTSYGTYPPYTI